MKRIPVFLPLALLLGCGSTTGGALITLPFQAGGAARDPSTPLSFVTPAGWTVTLQSARIALGPFYFNVSPPPTNAFRGGTFIIEVTRQVVVDALDPTLQDVPGGADGETGHAVAVEVGLLPPDDRAAATDQAFLRATSAGLRAWRRGRE
jgi:hypothetical protein